MKIPCETIVRFANLIDPTVEDTAFHAIRLDHGCIVASDRGFLAVEQIGGWDGVHHIRVPEDLLKQCETEAMYGGSVEIIANPALQFTICKTTLGWASVDNIGVFPPACNAFDRWREIVKLAAEPAVAPKGAMIWQMDGLIRLAKCAPSGVVSFEQVIDAESNRPTVVRDINSPDWVGFFLPRISDGKYHGPAVLPGWLK